MTLATLPRKWATDAAFASGPDIGTSPRVDPGAAISAQGFIPHSGIAAQHENHILGRIIDHLHAQEDAAESYYEIRDDFMPGSYDEGTGGGGLLHTELTWQISDGMDLTQGPLTTITGGSGNPGCYFVSVPADDSHEMHLGAEIANGALRWGNIEHVVIVFGVVSTNLTGHEVFVGLASQFSDNNVGDDAIGLYFNRTLSANWLVRHKSGGSDDATDTSVPVVSDGVVVLKIDRINSNQVTVRLNGTLIATLTDDGGAPADSAMLNVGMVTNAGSLASVSPKWDLSPSAA